MRSFNCAIRTDTMLVPERQRRAAIATKLREIAALVEQGAIQATLRDGGKTIGMFVFEGEAAAKALDG